MTEFIGPDVAQVTYKPVIEIADSKKNEDGVSLKTAGSYGSTEFTADEIVSIYVYVRDFLKAKGLDPDLEAAANRALDQSYLSGKLGDSLREGESISINGVTVASR